MHVCLRRSVSATGQLFGRLRPSQTLLVCGGGFERPLFPCAPLHRHGHFEELNKFLLGDPLIVGLVHVRPDSWLTSNRD